MPTPRLTAGNPASIGGVGRLLAIACAAVVLAGCGGADKHATACSGQTMTHYVTYRARGRPGVPVNPSNAAATKRALCARARAAGLTGVDVRITNHGEFLVGGPNPPPPSLGAPARLAFYDWEPNLLPRSQSAPTPTLLDAVRKASRQRASGGGAKRYYVFGRGAPGASDANAFYSSCAEISAAFRTTSGCKSAAGRSVIAVPSGVVVLKDERAGYWVLADRPELTNADITNPKQAFDPQTNEPIVTFGFTDRGRQAFARVTKREAQRGAQVPRPPGTPIYDTFQSFGIALDNQLVSRAVIDYQQNPNGIPGDTGAQINGLGDIGQTQQIARSMGSTPLPLDLVRIGSR